MVTTMLRLVGIDVKRLAREATITIVLAMPTSPRTRRACSGSALLAGALFAIAFLRGSRKPRTHTDDALRAAAGPVQASAGAIAQAADEAVNGAADIVRYGSREQIAGTIATAALIGWALGRRAVR